LKDLSLKIENILLLVQPEMLLSRRNCSDIDIITHWKYEYIEKRWSDGRLHYDTWVM